MKIALFRNNMLFVMAFLGITTTRPIESSVTALAIGTAGAALGIVAAGKLYNNEKWKKKFMRNTKVGEKTACAIHIVAGGLIGYYLSYLALRMMGFNSGFFDTKNNQAFVYSSNSGQESRNRDQLNAELERLRLAAENRRIHEKARARERKQARKRAERERLEQDRRRQEQSRSESYQKNQQREHSNFRTQEHAQGPTEPTHYNTLGIDRNASENDIKKAYKKLALQFHPDKNQSPEAEDRFKKIGEAYGTLSDLTKKREYDDSLARETTTTTAAPFDTADPNDIFNMFFSNPQYPPYGSYRYSGPQSYRYNWSYTRHEKYTYNF